MPHPKKGESKNKYIHRAIKHFMKKEGRTQQQAIAMAHSFWRKAKGKKKKE